MPVAISFVYRFIVAWLGAVGFFMLARHMLPESGESWFAQAVTRPGRETLGIYAVHGLILCELVQSGFGSFLCLSGRIAVVAAVAFALSLAVVCVLRRIPYLKGLVS